MAFRRTHIAAWLVLVLGMHTAVAHAEPVLVSLEGAGTLALGAPQNEQFGFGVSGSVGFFVPLTPAVLLGGKLRAGFLSDGDAPARAGLEDPGLGTLQSAAVMLRLRPFAAGQGIRRATGLFLDAGGGGGVTGELTRAGFEAGIGYGIALGASTSLAPVVRYVQIVQPEDPLSSDDARLLTLGVEVSFFDAQPPAPVENKQAIAEISDIDKDGVADLHDKCLEVPEDQDGHQDADGCPELDNDGDRIIDVDDKCPDQSEDFDDFADQDGCPDPDNDEDAFLDGDDQCPNEAEIVNGNKDYDGCPDDGLFEFKNDRIVLEERVLFDFERARVKREARPVLRAIVVLKAQHPEWIKLRIEGHADQQGDKKFNQELSERRANNVVEELVKLGIPASQIEFVGYGSSRPRDRRSEGEGFARNRRVEFVVVARGVAAPGTATTPTPAAETAADADEAQDAEEEKAPGKPTKQEASKPSAPPMQEKPR